MSTPHPIDRRRFLAGAGALLLTSMHMTLLGSLLVLSNADLYTAFCGTPPDLFGIRNQPKESILLHILVPDHEITQGFAAYTVATRDGRVLTGLVASETPTSLTLKQPLGKEDVILRSDIDELAASTQSLMPQGLEKNIPRQEFADLLAYLKGE